MWLKICEFFCQAFNRSSDPDSVWFFIDIPISDQALTFDKLQMLQYGKTSICYVDEFFLSITLFSFPNEVLFAY